MEKFLKDCDVLSRRTLLGSGALVGVGALFAACGQQANNEAAATTTAVSSESASASATPSTVRGYSGGSKAPDGEYRKADKYGNAQNVPKPADPEDGYREKSVEGMRKTLKAWVEWANYGTETGDYSVTNTFISPSFKEELEFNKKISSTYEKGGWVIGGVHNFKANGAPWSEDGTSYIWRVYREWDFVMYVEPDGSWESFENEKGANNMWDIKLSHNGERWLIESTTLVKN